MNFFKTAGQLVALCGLSLCGFTHLGCMTSESEGAKYDRADLCLESALVRYLNDGRRGDATLMDQIGDAGAGATVAERIVGARPFSDIGEIDAVRGVGARTLEKLYTLVADACVSHTSSGSVRVIFSPAQSYDLSHLKAALDAVEGAERSIDLAMYSFSDSAIEAALVAAHDRGVEVRVVLDQAHKTSAWTHGLAIRLEEAGIRVRSAGSKIMHHKFVLVDALDDSGMPNPDATLITGSANWTASAAYARAGQKAYDENTFVITGHAKLNALYHNDYGFIWDNGTEVQSAADSTHGPAITREPIDDFAQDDSADVLFTSDNFVVRQRRGRPTFSLVSRDSWAVANEIAEHIKAARESIWIASGHFVSPVITAAVVEALERAEAEGRALDVRLYVDQQDAGKDDVREIVAAGADVRVKMFMYKWAHPAAHQMHHKFFVIDGQKVLSGSYNLSLNAEQKTFENVTVLDAAGYQDLVAAFQTQFLLMWDHGPQALADLRADIADGGTLRIAHFGTFSVSLDSYYDLRDDMGNACSNLDSLFRDRAVRACFSKSRMSSNPSDGDLVKQFVTCDPGRPFPSTC